LAIDGCKLVLVLCGHYGSDYLYKITVYITYKPAALPKVTDMPQYKSLTFSFLLLYITPFRYFLFSFFWNVY